MSRRSQETLVYLKAAGKVLSKAFINVIMRGSAEILCAEYFLISDDCLPTSVTVPVVSTSLRDHFTVLGGLDMYASALVLSVGLISRYFFTFDRANELQHSFIIYIITLNGLCTKIAVSHL